MAYVRAAAIDRGDFCSTLLGHQLQGFLMLWQECLMLSSLHILMVASVMICGNDLGKQEDQPQTGQHPVKESSPQGEGGSISEGTLLSFQRVKKEEGENIFSVLQNSVSITLQ